MRDIKKHRQKLFDDAKGLCYYCNVKTEYPKGEENDGKSNLATIDHMYSRFNPYRLTPNTKNEKRHVLSCLQCNQLRARLEEVVRYLSDGIFLMQMSGGKIAQVKRSECKSDSRGGTQTYFVEVYAGVTLARESLGLRKPRVASVSFSLPKTKAG